MSLSYGEVPVEILELTPRWLAGGLAANFARVQILVTWYDGDPQLWLEAIESGQTPGDEADVAFLESMTQRIATDARFIEDMRRIVGEFAARFGGA
jgi:hypothetical protein